MDTSRHRDYFSPHVYKTPITIIGAGATGSRVFEACVNLGMTDIVVWDHDKVEAHNLANQLYVAADVEKPKVEALRDWSNNKTGCSVGYMRARKVEGNQRSRIDGIVFLLTDTIASRREIYANSLRFNPSIDRVIETRMALVHGGVRMFDPKNTRQSAEWLEDLPLDDSIDEADASACGTALTVGTTASIIANLAVNQMIHHLRGDNPDECIDVLLEPLFISATRWNDGTQEQTA